MTDPWILWFDDLGITDVPRVGGKNASLGEMRRALTQLVLGVDRDSELIAHLFDERDPAVKVTIAQAIRAARAAGRKIGICGQAPSDYPGFARFLVEEGIDSISLNADSVLRTLRDVAEIEAATAGATQEPSPSLAAITNSVIA